MIRMYVIYLGYILVHIDNKQSDIFGTEQRLLRDG